jgi:hypothetical protein
MNAREAMIDQPGATVRPRFDRLKLWATAMALVFGTLGVVFGVHRLGVRLPTLSRDAPMFLWIPALVLCRQREGRQTTWQDI